MIYLLNTFQPKVCMHLSFPHIRNMPHLTHFSLLNYTVDNTRTVRFIILPILYVKFQVLGAAGMKFRVFWDVLPCSEVDVNSSP
jgi:hypothetical protein